MSQFTDFAKQCLLDGRVPKGLPDVAYPFERDGDATYCKFDGITLEAATDAVGGTLVGFEWHGRTIVWLRIGEGVPAMRNTISLRGIEGRQRVTLTD